ncbi:MAG: YraN family protein [Paenibacillaceae bacterium]
MSNRTDQRKLTGRRGEDLAADYLTQDDYLIVERNWRCRSGELDLIARKDGLLIIIEVRSRKSLLQFGHPIESVERRKQTQVRRTAEVYVTMSSQSGSQIRFDVITVLLAKDGSLHEINHIQNAF